MKNRRYAERIRVRGLVQGVGFRPTIWNLAIRCQLNGAVWNDAEGVVIEAVGDATKIDRLIDLLDQNLPSLAVIDAIERTTLDSIPVYSDFSIIESKGGVVLTGIVPDAATCDNCLRDIKDPQNRRYRYPFTNCTHCGPRLSIIKAIPYDRATTSMAAFIQCQRCLSEYQDPADRRFHAQPNACPECGPHVWLEDAVGQVFDSDQYLDPIQRAAAFIRAGAIVAIKGIGGVHLACDAGSEVAVDALRTRKCRYHKAFALMARDPSMIRRYARINQQEERLLKSVAAPIVVLDQGGDERLAVGVAPGQNTLGFMLPYTPLHHLLMEELSSPIVLTSGNRSDEPQVISNDESRMRLAGIADFWLLHDREIVNRLDDSVVRIIDNEVRTLRRARGYAPAPIYLSSDFLASPAILALGGELKSTFCLLKGGSAILSQHIGDLENVSTLKEFRHMLELYLKLFEHEPAVVVIDGHPDYLSSQWGQRYASEKGLPLERVQHHHAHIAACMAEHGVGLGQSPVLGIALDGLGMGDQGELWGGEFLKVSYVKSRRLGRFHPVPMLGGAKAMYEPWRNTLAYLLSYYNWQTVTADYAGLELIRFLQSKPIANLQQMMKRGLNSPLASSCGRLFDAVAAAINICRERASHEGQAAIELEAIVDKAELAISDHAYPHVIGEEEGQLVLNWQPLWGGLLEDLRIRLAPGIIAARFHSCLINAVSRAALTLCRQEQIDTVVLSGGVFQNRLLLEGVSQALSGYGLRVLIPSKLPANDGGLALGQAVIAAARLIGRKTN